MESEAQSQRGSKDPMVDIQFMFNNNRGGSSGPDSASIVIQDSPAIDMNKGVDTSITAFTYTGRHDHGPLPALKSTGYLAELTAALYDAKAACDSLLTDKMKESGAASSTTGTADEEGSLEEESVSNVNDANTGNSEAPITKKAKRKN
jgi:branched-subunit amino acid aminotransferase/4-amino-4-deoxychorismate lyase